METDMRLKIAGYISLNRKNKTPFNPSDLKDLAREMQDDGHVVTIKDILDFVIFKLEKKERKLVKKKTLLIQSRKDHTE